MSIDMDSGAVEGARIAIVTPDGAGARASYSGPRVDVPAEYRDCPGISPGARGGQVGRRAMHQNVNFDPFSFETSAGRLWCGAQEVRLTPKAAAVLNALVAQAGEPVSKEALFSSVWRDAVVSDDALISVIQELRRALADDPKRPRFIETRHRRGYRFVARVSKPAAPAANRAYAKDRASDHSDRPTIVVLPFENLGSDPEQEYFSDAITQDIITALSKHRSLLVIARGPTFAFKGRNAN